MWKKKEGLVQNNIVGKMNDWAIVFCLLQKNVVVKKICNMSNLDSSTEKGTKWVDVLLVQKVKE